MEILQSNWFWATILLPVIIGIFKKEIATFINDYRTYRNRSFDEDGDPSTGQDCYILNEATGDYNKITVAEYKFGLGPSKRKIITYQNDPEGDNSKIIAVPYSYSKWSSMVKGSLQKDKASQMRKL